MKQTKFRFESPARERQKLEKKFCKLAKIDIISILKKFRNCVKNLQEKVKESNDHSNELVEFLDCGKDLGYKNVVDVVNNRNY